MRSRRAVLNKVTDEELDAYIISQRIDGNHMQADMGIELQELRKFAKQRWCSSELMDCNAKLKEADSEIIRLKNIISRQREMFLESSENAEIRIRNDFKEALDYLRQAKRQFTPNTTNSVVDDFLEKHKDFE